MPLRQPLPAQRHQQLKEEFLALTRQRLDLAPDTAAYAQKTTQIDQVLASVWALGTIYTRTPSAFDTR
jgi:hypothetical protein